MTKLNDFRALIGDPTSTQYDVVLYNFYSEEEDKEYDFECIPQEWLDDTDIDIALPEFFYTDEDLMDDLVERGVDFNSVDNLNNHFIIEHHGPHIFLNSYNLRTAKERFQLTSKEADRLYKDWENFKVLT